MHTRPPLSRADELHGLSLGHTSGHRRHSWRRSARASLANAAPVYQPPVLPVLGNIHQIDPKKLNISFHKLFGSQEEEPQVLKLNLLGKKVAVVRHPEDVTQVAVASKTFIKSGKARRLKYWLGNSFLLTRDEALWATVRATLSPAFRKEHLRQELGSVLVVGEELADALISFCGAEVDLQEFCKRAALDVFGLVALKHRFGSLASAARGAHAREGAPDVVQVLHSVAPTLTFLALDLPIPDRMMPGYPAYLAACDQLRGLVDDLLQQRRRSGRESWGADLLSFMLLEQARGNAAMSDSQIKDELMTLLFTGHDTTAGTLAFLLYHLAQHREWHELVAQEVRAELLSRPPEQWDMEEVMQLKVLGACINETLRLFPVGPGFARLAAMDAELHGCSIPQGTTVISSILCMHRHPALWPRAEEWLPQRWLPDQAAALGPARPDAFMPFGAGPRSCIGRNMALLEVQVLAAVVLNRVQLDPAPKRPLELIENITLSSASGAHVCARSRI